MTDRKQSHEDIVRYLRRVRESEYWRAREDAGRRIHSREQVFNLLAEAEADEDPDILETALLVVAMSDPVGGYALPDGPLSLRNAMGIIREAGGRLSIMPDEHDGRTGGE